MFHFKPKRKRFFSLIFVPDQDRDPKSISLSYGKGRLLLALLILLCLHTLLGVVGYIKLASLISTKRTLVQENEKLLEKNKRIDQIVKEFNAIRKTDEKIRKAFGVTLGLGEQPNPKAEADRPAGKTDLVSPASSTAETVEARPSGASPMYFISRKEQEYFRPENLPTLLPVNGVLTTYYNDAGGLQGRNHWGIDIAAQKGEVIQAAGAGVVLLADWTPDFGNMVIISHGLGYFTYYGHTMKALVEQGTRVKKGDPIALVGSSGISSAPHLHFEIWKDGKPINPEDMLYATQKMKTGTNE
jgi:murein DD-endopeptidase MepM/ murein hydrolase activator NlpD